MNRTSAPAPREVLLLPSLICLDLDRWYNFCTPHLRLSQEKSCEHSTEETKLEGVRGENPLCAWFNVIPPPRAWIILLQVLTLTATTFQQHLTVSKVW